MTLEKTLMEEGEEEERKSGCMQNKRRCNINKEGEAERQMMAPPVEMRGISSASLANIIAEGILSSVLHHWFGIPHFNGKTNVLD